MNATKRVTLCQRAIVVVMTVSLLALIIGAGGAVAQSDEVVEQDVQTQTTETGEVVEEVTIDEERTQEVEQSETTVETSFEESFSATGDDVVDSDAFLDDLTADLFPADVGLFE